MGTRHGVPIHLDWKEKVEVLETPETPGTEVPPTDDPTPDTGDGGGDEGGDEGGDDGDEGSEETSY